MHVINARNVNDAYYKGLEYLRRYGRPSPSRAGDVIVAPCPVTTVYQYPQERVLFDSVRDANPFFHLFEACWMLSGSNDARWLDQFVKDFSARFGEEGGTQHGAYGHRWRYAMGMDQLEMIVDRLREDPTDRQCVLQMWDCRNDPGFDAAGISTERIGMADLSPSAGWKDRPCNTHIYFRVISKDEPKDYDYGMEYVSRLHMTVCCRSNDAIWGAYGANAVHFSVLQEYLAAKIGVGIGTYYQISNNFHAYVGELGRVSKLPLEKVEKYAYPGKGVSSQPMVTDPESFDIDLGNFMAWTNNPAWPLFSYANVWFTDTATPMFMAATLCRKGAREAAVELLLNSGKMAEDWKVAAIAWVRRRVARAKEKV